MSNPVDDFPLAILAKAPIANKVKTRLIPALGSEEATRIHEALVRQTVAVALKTLPASRITLWTGLQQYHPLFKALAQKYGIQLKAQPEGGLGDRMHFALEHMGEAGLLIGTDCPVLTPDLLSSCYQSLADHDVVLLPAEDGGYGLIGTSEPHKALFENILWGTDKVFEQTQQAIAVLGLSLVCPATIWDVDRPEDVMRWRQLTSSK